MWQELKKTIIGTEWEDTLFLQGETEKSSKNKRWGVAFEKKMQLMEDLINESPRLAPFITANAELYIEANGLKRLLETCEPSKKNALVDRIAFTYRLIYNKYLENNKQTGMGL